MRRVSDLIIEFIGPLYNYLQQFTDIWHTVIFYRLDTSRELFWLPTECHFKSSLMLRPMVSRTVCLRKKHPCGTYDQIFITVRQLRVCSCGVLSPTRGRVCHLQLLLVLASAVILGSKSRGTRDHILLSQIWDSSNLEGQIPVIMSPRNRMVQLYLKSLGSHFVALICQLMLASRYIA
jgi:hypothetical protein